MNIKKIYHSLDRFESDMAPVWALEKEALEKRDRMLEELAAASRSDRLGVKDDHPLSVINEELRQKIQQITDQAGQSWEQTRHMRELSSQYRDRTLLLVCGKVNAGKSSLINFLAGAFDQWPQRAYCLSQGRRQEAALPLQEGCTETTKDIQWLEIGDKLVLMDSPGLHSVKPENGQLAREFLDAADGILWITSSRSAAQVHELEVLTSEMQSGKPVLPVLTQSDTTEEDEDDEGNIIDEMVPWPESSRKKLEADVKERVGDFMRRIGGKGDLRSPVSVSVKYHCEHLADEGVEQLSGMGELGCQIVWLIDQARAYKPRKAHQQMTNYLSQQLIEPIRQTLGNGMGDLQAVMQREMTALDQAKHSIADEAIDDLLINLPELVQKYRTTKDIQGLENALVEQIQRTVADRSATCLNRFLDSLGHCLTESCSLDLKPFTPITTEVRKVSGKVAKATVASAASLVGMAGGAFMGGPGGAFAGGTVAGAVGNRLGDKLVKERHVITDTGEVNASQVITSAQDSIQAEVPKQVERVINEIINTLKVSDRYLVQVREVINAFDADITRFLKRTQA